MSAMSFFAVIVIGAVGALLANMGGLGVAIAFWFAAAALAIALVIGAAARHDSTLKETQK